MVSVCSLFNLWNIVICINWHGEFSLKEMVFHRKPQDLMKKTFLSIEKVATAFKNTCSSSITKQHFTETSRCEISHVNRSILRLLESETRCKISIFSNIFLSIL